MEYWSTGVMGKIFWIFDFGFWIRGFGKTRNRGGRVSASYSDNLKSKIQNPKLLAVAVMLFVA